MAIEALHLDFEISTEAAGKFAAYTPKGVCEHQFEEVPIHKPKIFDWAFGVIVPLMCVAADPIVFRSAGLGTPLFGTYRPFAYLLSIASILSMAAWLLWGPKLKWLAAPMSGLFYIGGAVSLLVGIVLVPFSILGIMFYLIGFLGFTPLLSAIVFLRNASRAYKASLIALEDETAWRAAVLAGLFSFVIPYVINVQIVRGVNALANGDVTSIQRETTRLKFVAPLTDLSPVTKQYRRFGDTEKESPRAIELANAYKEISGVEIEDAPGDWD
jgi:hypothetical protein